MSVAHYIIPFEVGTFWDGSPVYQLPLRAANTTIKGSAGEWDWVELGNGTALVRVRASNTLLNGLKRDFGLTVVTDPTTLISQFRNKTWADLQINVPDDTYLSQLNTLADSLALQADQQGYVRLSRGNWLEETKILNLMAARGYGLDRVSTGTFPTTGLLDDFTRANEGPPPSSSWDYFTLDGWPGGLVVSSNACVAASAGYRSSYWKTSYGPASEAYVTLSTLGASSDIVWLTLRGASLGSGGGGGSSGTLYLAQLTFGASPKLDMYRRDSGSWNAMGTQDTVAISTGDKFGFEGISGTFQAYRYTGGSWATYGASRSDSTYSNAGPIAVGMLNTTCVIDDFSGGTVSGGGGASSLIVSRHPMAPLLVR